MSDGPRVIDPMNQRPLIPGTQQAPGFSVQLPPELVHAAKMFPSLEAEVMDQRDRLQGIESFLREIIDDEQSDRLDQLIASFREIRRVMNLEPANVCGWGKNRPVPEVTARVEKVGDGVRAHVIVDRASPLFKEFHFSQYDGKDAGAALRKVEGKVMAEKQRALKAGLYTDEMLTLQPHEMDETTAARVKKQVRDLPK